MLQWLPRDAEQLAMESGGDGVRWRGSCEREVDEVKGRLVGTCILAPGEMARRAGNRLMLAAAV
jgi:hypothetical protein